MGFAKDDGKKNLPGAALSIVPCSSVVELFFNFILGNTANKLIDSNKNDEGVKMGDATGSMLDAQLKEFVKLIDSSNKSETIYWAVREAFRSFKEKMWEFLAK